MICFCFFYSWRLKMSENESNTNGDKRPEPAVEVMKAKYAHILRNETEKICM